MRKAFLATAFVLGAVAVGLTGAAQASPQKPIAPTAAAAGTKSGAAAPSISPQYGNNAVFFSNLGPGGSFQSTAWCVSGATGGCGNRYDEAMSFTPSISGRVTQIDIGLIHASGTNAAVVKLAADNGGVPGAVLAAVGVANQPALGATCCPTTALISPSVPIGAGHKYWVIAVAGASNTLDGWNWNYNNTQGTFAYSNNGTTWSLTSGAISAFDVVGCSKLCHV